MVILVVFKGFLWVKNLEILIQIVPERPIYFYLKYHLIKETLSNSGVDSPYLGALA